MTDAALFDRLMVHFGLLLSHYPHVLTVRDGLRSGIEEPDAVAWCTAEFGPRLPVAEPPPFADHTWGSVAHAFFFRDHAAAMAFKLRWS